MQSWLLSEVWNIKTTILATYIFNRENPQNSEPQNGPRRGLDFIALERPHGYWNYKEFSLWHHWKSTVYVNYFIEFILIYFKEKQTANEVQTQQEQPKVKEQGAKKKHGNEDLESKKKAPKKAKKEPTTQPCMPDLIKSTQQAKEVCCIL